MGETGLEAAWRAMPNGNQEHVIFVLLYKHLSRMRTSGVIVNRLGKMGWKRLAPDEIAEALCVDGAVRYFHTNAKRVYVSTFMARDVNVVMSHSLYAETPISRGIRSVSDLLAAEAADLSAQPRVERPSPLILFLFCSLSSILFR